MCVASSFIGLFLYYFPPAHPRGLPFKQAAKELDYGGGILFIVATTLILTGINYTTILPASSATVIGLLVSGFGLMVCFALYETFVPLKQPLTPTRVFTRGGGRALTAPFVAAFVVTVSIVPLNRHRFTLTCGTDVLLHGERRLSHDDQRLFLRCRRLQISSDTYPTLESWSRFRCSAVERLRNPHWTLALATYH